jgi:hypothetical protein
MSGLPIADLNPLHLHTNEIDVVPVQNLATEILFTRFGDPSVALVLLCLRSTITIKPGTGSYAGKQKTKWLMTFVLSWAPINDKDTSAEEIAVAKNKNDKTGTQRALVLQGGGALGAYDAGVFRALYNKLSKEDKQNGESGRALFDIVVGTSSGAMNGAILVSHVKEKGTWEGSVEKLNAFWDYVSTDPDLWYYYPYYPNKKEWISQWDVQKIKSQYSCRRDS